MYVHVMYPILDLTSVILARSSLSRSHLKFVRLVLRIQQRHQQRRPTLRLALRLAPLLRQ